MSSEGSSENYQSMVSTESEGKRSILESGGDG